MSGLGLSLGTCGSVDVSVLASISEWSRSRNQGSWSQFHLVQIDKHLGLGLGVGIKGLGLGIGLGQLDVVHIHAINTEKIFPIQFARIRNCTLKLNYIY